MFNEAFSRAEIAACANANQKEKRASSAITFTVSNKRYTCNDSLLRKIYT